MCHLCRGRGWEAPFASKAPIVYLIGIHPYTPGSGWATSAGVGNGRPHFLAKAPYLPRIAQIRKENALYAPDETLTGFVSTPGIAYLYTVSTSIDEKFYVALSEPTQRRDQLDKSAHLLVQVTASLSRQLHFRDCEDKPCKVRGGICHRRVP